MKHLFILFIFLIGSLNESQATVTVINGLTHVHSGSSGDVIFGEVILLNNSDSEQRVRFDLSEAIFTCDNGRKFVEDNPHNQSATDWYKSELNELSLAPYERYTYRYKISIPDNHTLSGTYWTVLMVSVEAPIKEEVLNNSVGLNTKIRYAVALLTHVNSLDDVNLQFNDVMLDQVSDITRNQLDVKVQNFGSFVEGVVLTLEVYDANGNRIHKIKSDRNMVFPGVCRNYKLDISEIPPGEYQCLLLADSRKEFVGTNLSISLK